MRHAIRRSAAVALLCLFAAACGNDADTGSAPASSTTALPTTTTAAPTKKLSVAVVTPSAADDLAFSQPMIDALQGIAAERGAEFMSLQTTTEMFQTDKAREAIIDYAEGGANIIVAHSDAFGPIVEELAPQYPEITFVWGTEIDTFGMPNVFSYGLAADEGAYVMGVLAAEITESDKVGIVGPIESGDAKLFVDGFKKGVHDTKASVQTDVTYIDSFSDVVKAAAAAKTFTDGGADVLTGSSEAMAGAVPVVVAADAAWFGNQSNQTSLSPDAVVASQVYHFENMLRDVISRVETGDLGGEEYELTLANGGLVIEYNENYKLPADARAKADAAEDQIIAGALAPNA
ncbi:MAG: BMP family ABC transporter substrate-binding protein [Acidimicrobiia bacterium]